jgi:hypothetical protein
MSTVETIRSVLDELKRVENADNDTKEIVFDRELAKIRDLPRAGILQAVLESIGRSQKRKQYAPYVFAELSDVPGIEKVFSELLVSSEAAGRGAIIQEIGLRKMYTLVGVLNDHFASESDDFCRSQLLHTLATLADESSLPIFVYLMTTENSHDEWPILCAAHNYAREEFRRYAQAVFDSILTKKSNKILAAWALAKLGDNAALEYLKSMLSDPATSSKTTTSTTYDPGESIRAAQALADINGWDFEWGRSAVENLKARLEAATT